MSRALTLAIVLVTAMTGCYSAEEHVETVRLDDETGRVTIENAYHGLGSDAPEDDTLRAKADFDQLMGRWRGTKTGRLWIEGDRLHGMEQDRYSGLGDPWEVDSTGFYYQTTDTLVTTDGSMSAGRWHWPPGTRLMIVREPRRAPHWQSEFVSWYRAYRVQYGLDESGMSPGPAHRKRVLVSPTAGLGLPLGPTASLVTAISLAEWGLASNDPPAVILDGSIGIGGWRASLGYGGASYGDANFLWGTGVAGARATVVRTWGRPFNARAGETYVGATLLFRVADDHDDPGVGIDLGALYRIDGPKDRGRLMPYLSLDVGRFFAF